MAVFEIHSSYQQHGTLRCFSFQGFFTLDERSQEIRGYMEADSSTFPQKRYIYGMYDRSRDLLAYLQLSNTSNISPLMFMFPIIKLNGFWSAYDQDMELFFPFRKANGTAQVTLKEVTNPVKADLISEYVYDTFIECSDLISNMMLIHKGVQPYLVDFGIN